MAGIAKFTTIELLRELERRVNCNSKPEKRTIFFGPPGAGFNVRIFRFFNQ
jgi:adenylate kinase